MAAREHFHWIRIVLAVLAAEALPILLLIAVVFVYSLTRQPDSLSPEQFAPVAGNWVGPIGGFLATLLCATRVARGAIARPLAHGLAVGVGTALLDLCLATLLAGGVGALTPLLLLSNSGRILAGALGGLLGAGSADTPENAD